MDHDHYPCFIFNRLGFNPDKNLLSFSAVFFFRIKSNLPLNILYQYWPSVSHTGDKQQPSKEQAANEALFE
jgi:hypothetical protein